jgi:hypothetical protein
MRWCLSVLILECVSSFISTPDPLPCNVMREGTKHEVQPSIRVSHSRLDISSSSYDLLIYDAEMMTTFVFPHTIPYVILYYRDLILLINLIGKHSK